MSKNKREASIMDSAIMEYIIRNLPSGSGIDASWECENWKNFYVFNNSYHCMDEHGGYDGWQNFQIRVDKINWKIFHLYFTGYRKENYIYTLREMLEDTIYHCLDTGQDNLEYWMSDRVNIELSQVYVYYECRETPCTNIKPNLMSVEQIIEAGQPLCHECEEPMDQVVALSPYLDRRC